MENKFWQHLETLIAEATIKIDRPKGSTHPRYSDIIDPLDYGYLAGTSSGDGAGVDVWLGTLPAQSLTGVICCVDLSKRDVELKLLLGCAEDEMTMLLAFHNEESQAAHLVRRAA